MVPRQDRLHLADLYFSLSWPTGDQIEELFAYIGMALVSVFSGWQNPLRHEDVERSLTVLLCLNLILALFKLLVTYATVFADRLHVGQPDLLHRRG